MQICRSYVHAQHACGQEHILLLSETTAPQNKRALRTSVCSVPPGAPPEATQGRVVCDHACSLAKKIRDSTLAKPQEPFFSVVIRQGLDQARYRKFTAIHFVQLQSCHLHMRWVSSAAVCCQHCKRAVRHTPCCCVAPSWGSKRHAGTGFRPGALTHNTFGGFACCSHRGLRSWGRGRVPGCKHHPQ